MSPANAAQPVVRATFLRLLETNALANSYTLVYKEERDAGCLTIATMDTVLTMLGADPELCLSTKDLRTMRVHSQYRLRLALMLHTNKRSFLTSHVGLTKSDSTQALKIIAGKAGVGRAVFMTVGDFENLAPNCRLPASLMKEAIRIFNDDVMFATGVTETALLYGKVYIANSDLFAEESPTDGLLFSLKNVSVIIAPFLLAGDWVSRVFVTLLRKGTRRFDVYTIYDAGQSDCFFVFCFLFSVFCFLLFCFLFYVFCFLLFVFCFLLFDF
jgi:hypothetical protein